MDFNQATLMQLMYQVIIVVAFVYCLKLLASWMGMSDRSPFTWVAIGLVLFFVYRFFMGQ